MDSSIEPLLLELAALYKKSTHRFPYEDCRKLRRQNAGYEGLEPDLDLYLKTIALCCVRPRKILKWPTPKVEKAQEWLAQTFFEKNPEYKPLRSHVTEENTPDLHADLVLHEKMRETLLRLFSLLRRES